MRSGPEDYPESVVEWIVTIGRRVEQGSEHETLVLYVFVCRVLRAPVASRRPTWIEGRSFVTSVLSTDVRKNPLCEV